MTDAEKVWTCLCLYNTDAAKGLIKLGYTSRIAVAVLGKYPKRKEYHGHCSGGSGDGENQGASDNRAAALSYLEGKTEEIASYASAKKVPDKQKEATNREHIQRLKDIITNAANLGTAQEQLTLIDPDWRTRGDCDNHYKLTRDAKRQKK